MRSPKKDNLNIVKNKRIDLTVRFYQPLSLKVLVDQKDLQKNPPLEVQT